MKLNRILLLVHTSLIPDLSQKKPNRTEAWITEYDVAIHLKAMGHEVHILGLYDDIKPLQDFLAKTPIDLVFNLLEQFGEYPERDQHVTSLLEMLNLKYTGCGPKAMTLARDKALSKKLVDFHHIATPQFFVIPKRSKKKIPKNLKFPIIVKCLSEEASLGLSQNSVVSNYEKLTQRIDYLQKKYDVDVICEEFIKGREVYIGALRDKKIITYPIIELLFEKADDPSTEFFSERAKWNEKYQKRKGIKTDAAKLTSELEKRIHKMAQKIMNILHINSYARIDLRISDEGKIYFLEANPNPNLAIDDEFYLGAKLSGLNYPDLLTKIIQSA